MFFTKFGLACWLLDSLAAGLGLSWLGWLGWDGIWAGLVRFDILFVNLALPFLQRTGFSTFYTTTKRKSKRIGASFEKDRKKERVADFEGGAPILFFSGSWDRTEQQEKPEKKTRNPATTTNLEESSQQEPSRTRDGTEQRKRSTREPSNQASSVQAEPPASHSIEEQFLKKARPKFIQS